MQDTFFKKASKESFKYLLSKFFTAVFFILCITTIFEVVMATAEARTPRFFGYSVSYVPTESMEPTIMAGDYVLFKNTSFEEVKEEDIIVYRSASGRFIIHRIIEKNDDYIICQGDNNPIADEEHITSDMIIGKYVSTVAILHIFSGGINQNLVYIFLVILFIILIVTQVASIAIKSQTDALKKKNDQALKDKEIMLEEMRKQILAEELEKLKNKKKE